MHCGSGRLGRPASESGRLRRRDGGHEGGDRRRKVLMLACMKRLAVSSGRASVLSTDPPLANPEDMNIPRCVASSDAAIAALREHHDRWLREQAG